jgi:two-component system, LytTR family, sensor kinase
LDIVEFFADGFQKLKQKPLVLLVNASVWLVILIVTTILISNITTLKHAFAFSFFNIGMLAFAYYLNIYFVNRFIEKQKYSIYIFLLIALIVGVTYSRFYINSFYLATYLESYTFSNTWKYFFSGLSTLMVVAISLFYGLLINRSRKEREYQLIIFKQQQQQLDYLKAQMSPHFLFNSLNNIYSLTIGKAPKATEMVLLLAEVLRYALYESKNKQVALTTEIDQINKLISLYKLKSETPLAITFNSLLSSPTASIEPMLLIPLVENCFKHGNIHHASQGFIFMELNETNGLIRFHLKNSKDTQPKEETKDSGIGLKNIQQRLLLLYPNRHSLLLTEEPDNFTVLLQIDKRNE